MDFKILLLVLALGISCGCKCKCHASVVTTDIYSDESRTDSVVLQQINLQQQQKSEVDVVGELRKNKQICKFCKKIATPVLKFLSNSSNQEKINSTLVKICSLLPGLKKKFNDIVKHYFPLFVLQVAALTPKTFCIAVKFCDLIPIPSSDLSEDITDTCNDLVEEVSLNLKDPNAQLKTIEVLMKGCDVLRTLRVCRKRQCKTLVSSYAPLILDNVEQFFGSYCVSSSTSPHAAEN